LDSPLYKNLSRNCYQNEQNPMHCPQSVIRCTDGVTDIGIRDKDKITATDSKYFYAQTNYEILPIVKNNTSRVYCILPRNLPTSPLLHARPACLVDIDQ